MLPMRFRLPPIRCENYSGVLLMTVCLRSAVNARIKKFLPGGRGSRHDCQKTALTAFDLVQYFPGGGV